MKKLLIVILTVALLVSLFLVFFFNTKTMSDVALETNESHVIGIKKSHTDEDVTEELSIEANNLNSSEIVEQDEYGIFVLNDIRKNSRVNFSDIGTTTIEWKHRDGILLVSAYIIKANNISKNSHSSEQASLAYNFPYKYYLKQSLDNRGFRPVRFLGYYNPAKQTVCIESTIITDELVDEYSISCGEFIPPPEPESRKFVNELFDYEIMYPGEWPIKESPGNSTNVLLTSDMNEGVRFANFYSYLYPGVWVSITPFCDDSSAWDFKKEPYLEGLKAPILSKSWCKNDFVITGFVYEDSKTLEDDKRVVESVADSFDYFGEKEISWVEYQNEQLGFSFKHPSYLVATETPATREYEMDPIVQFGGIQVTISNVESVLEEKKRLDECSANDNCSWYGYFPFDLLECEWNLDASAPYRMFTNPPSTTTQPKKSISYEEVAGIKACRENTFSNFGEAHARQKLVLYGPDDKRYVLSTSLSFLNLRDFFLNHPNEQLTDVGFVEFAAYRTRLMMRVADTFRFE